MHCEMLKGSSHLPLRVPALQPVYLVGKNAGLNYWAKRLMPDATWINMMINTLK